MKDPFGVFNLSEFKKWVDESNDKKSIDNFIGSLVESKISFKKLLDVGETIEVNSKKVLKEFILNGGNVIGKNENTLLIENKKGKFELHKMYIKIV